APYITTEPVLVATVGEDYEYDANAIDPDGEIVTFELFAGPAGMSIDPQTGLIPWSPLAGDEGEHQVVVRALDASGDAGVQGYRLDVRPANLPPQFTSTPLTEAVIGVRYRYDANAIDAHDAVSFSLASAPEGMT